MISIEKTQLLEIKTEELRTIVKVRKKTKTNMINFNKKNWLNSTSLEFKLVHNRNI